MPCEYIPRVLNLLPSSISDNVVHPHFPTSGFAEISKNKRNIKCHTFTILLTNEKIHIRSLVSQEFAYLHMVHKVVFLN